LSPKTFAGATGRLSFLHSGQSIFSVVQNTDLEIDSVRPDGEELKTGVYKMESLAFVPQYEVPA
jgi:hypothetical protein